MPGLLETSLEQGRQAIGLGGEAARAGADVAMRRAEEKYNTQAGIGQAVGTVVGYKGAQALRKKPGQADTTSLSKILGSVSQHLFNHWLPQHDAFPMTTYTPPQTPDTTGLAPQPETLGGLSTTPQPAPTSGGSATDPFDYSDKFNTQLSPDEESKFQEWAKANNRSRDTFDYDMRGAWQEMQTGGLKQSENGHFPDKYKKPNHPTFSNESIYSTADTPGGKWQSADGKWTFVASPTNLKARSAAELQDYFNSVEPGNTLALPEQR